LLLVAHLCLTGRAAANPVRGYNHCEGWSALFIARLLSSCVSASHTRGLATTCLAASKVVYQEQAAGGTGQMCYM